MWLRNLGFDFGVFRSVRFPVPVIVVGNLRVGGTGKTPAVDAFVRMLKDKRSLAVLSRGYGRTTIGWREVEIENWPETVGDEPLLIKSHHPDVKVVVMENRVQGIRQLLVDEPKPDVIILDDAMQHRWVQAGHLVLLTAYHDLYIDDHILPVGRLRESKSEAARADSIIITKCPLGLTAMERRGIRISLNLSPHQSVFFAFESYPGLKPMVPKLPPMTWEGAKSIHWLLVTGLADTTTLIRHISNTLPAWDTKSFKDHHPFSETDMNGLKDWVLKDPDKKRFIITTEKDALRMTKWFQNEKFADLPVYAILHEMDWFEEDKQGIEERINGFIKAY